ncbi:MAG: glycerophosphodiester phosphodiesterase family protein [Chitinophagales bacterium]
MKKVSLIFLVIIVFISSCHQDKIDTKFDIEGHRGARGYLPENSLEGFKKAIEMGVTTLEMDVVITKDKQVILSHEPWISPSICLDSAGHTIADSLKHFWNIYELTYEEVTLFQCGSFPHNNFPDQKQIPHAKPLLKEVIHLAESMSLKKALNLSNIILRLKVELKGMIFTILNLKNMLTW